MRDSKTKKKSFRLLPVEIDFCIADNAGASWSFRHDFQRYKVRGSLLFMPGSSCQKIPIKSAVTFTPRFRFYALFNLGYFRSRFYR